MSVLAALAPQSFWIHRVNLHYRQDPAKHLMNPIMKMTLVTGLDVHLV
ncbi:unnamed protein product [Acanthoscelides obtectus]|uniref:Uncharacterized protein n=1 Tax=Acanthoscelides obtectus TaxID=200917 RepID=A0A9P0KTT0_ACAOB|nr:unnamed protein product [Acanthoscelides obtectus]CAK1655971.1 hypothetical protein AOBTE_LOCUS19481 [Acanthoscelides obtectus]